MEQPKPWYKSVTLLVNLAVFAVLVIDLAVSGLGLSAEVVKWLLFLQAVINGALRLIRDNPPIEGTPAAKRHALYRKPLTKDPRS